MKSRLLELVNRLADGNPALFADECGIPRSAMEDYGDGTMPSAEHLIGIRKAFHVNINWLLTGEGDANEVSGISLDNLPAPTCRLVDILDSPEEMPDRWRHLKNEFICVPLVNIEIAAGQPIMEEEYIEGWAVIHVAHIKGKKDLVAVRVKGKSMEPTLSDRSIVCIDRTQKTITNGAIYAVSLHDGSVVKRVFKNRKTLQLVSDNPDPKYRQAIILNLNEMEGRNPVVGKVIWSWTVFEGKK